MNQALDARSLAQSRPRLLLASLALLILLIAPVRLDSVKESTAEAAPTPPKVLSIDDLITQDAAKYSVSRESLYKTLKCESANFTVLDGQSEVIRKDGTREPSWGIAQFYLPSSLKTASGEEITKEIATDPAQAIDAAAYNFSIGNAGQWTCWKTLQK